MSSETRVGETLASKYKLEALLGSGGMGHVYRAVNQLVGRPVAIKLLKAEHAENPAIRERFLREARTANLVRHPHVVDIVDIDQDAKGVPFIVQELLEGEDLGRFVARKGGKLPLATVLDILLPVIDAVAEAHVRGVVHRDIKPENVFLAKSAHSGSPIPKLLDFGISKVAASSDVRSTEAGVMMGTPAYMPPEQVQGARDADARSDIWALGVMMFELIAGRLPFDVADAPALFVAIATRDAPSLLDVRAEVTPNMSRIVARCLRRRPDDRYPSAAELARDLRHIIDGDEVEPTGQRSLPPSAMAVLVDTKIPPAPLAPTIPGDAPSGGEPPKAVSSKVVAKPIPEAPDLPPPPSLPLPLPKPSSSSKQAAAAPAKPPPPTSSSPARAAAAAPPANTPRAKPAQETPRANRLASNAALPGVVLAPGTAIAPSSPTRSGAHSAWGIGPSLEKKHRADMTAVYGIAVVGIVAIAIMGVLMQLAHRVEGWPLGKFVIGGEKSDVPQMAVNGGLALVAFAISITYALRGHRHWRGELGGGPPNAVVSAVVAGGAFFCAIELVSAMY